jgi:enamine deaminase RidA (YjgF/YER057c/UK114 family)
VLPIENPRQVSAYAYPTRYGPKAPNFSRAALWPATATAPAQLFISGTASIVGHETQHVGDVVAQAHELLRNVSVLVERAAAEAKAPMTLADLTANAYVRHIEDLERVRAVLVAHGFDMERVLFLQADICRAELLVEIEAMGTFSDLSRASVNGQA